jgi:hypothetical protein
MTENHGVPGSNPGAATPIFCWFTAKKDSVRNDPADEPGLLLQPYCNPSRVQFIYVLRYFVLHVGQEVRVDV